MTIFWKSMGCLLLFIFLSFALISGLKLWFTKIIARAENANKSVKIRKTYAIIRFILLVLFIIVGVFMWGIVLIISFTIDKYMAVLCFCGGGSCLLALFSSLSLPISFMTMNKFMSQEKSFILYLRGFITDDYTPTMDELAETVNNLKPWSPKNITDNNIEDPNQLPLNEISLTSAWNYCPIRFCNVVSIGRPKELESPEGSERVYLDNDCWKEDAMTLMKFARYILVYVHPSSNCIWEIQQCNTYFPEKTIYYIDDINKLNYVRKIMGEKTPLCLKSDNINRNHMVAYLKEGLVVVNAYTNTDDGLTKTVSEYFKT
jgi:hypothetical protein